MRTPRPRWLISFFRSGGSSAIVIPLIRHEEERVVAEAASAARCLEHHAVAAADEHLLAPIRQGDGGGVVRGSLRGRSVGEAAEEERVFGLILPPISPSRGISQRE